MYMDRGTEGGTRGKRVSLISSLNLTLITLVKSARKSRVNKVLSSDLTLEPGPAAAGSWL
jgi:hypothetical protein